MNNEKITALICVAASAARDLREHGNPELADRLADAIDAVEEER